MKNLKILLICLSILFCSMCTVSAMDVYVDGKKVDFNDNMGYPYIENNRTMVPLRATAEACGAEVTWDGEYQTACVRKNEVTVYCTVGDKNIYRNSTRIENDVAAANIGGRVYLPIRAVLEALDATVLWDGDVKVICGGKESFIEEIENSSYKIEDVWGEWTKALDLKANGEYSQAIEKLRRLAPSFLSSHDYDSRAVFYNNLAQCYCETSAFKEAAHCFEREADNWNAAGKEQERIAAQRRAAVVRPTIQIYAKTSRENYKMRKNFGELYEPENGLYIGAYAECDEEVHNPSSMNKFYMNEFPKMAGRDMSSYLLYMNDAVSFSHYNSHFTVAKQKDKIMQIALEPTNIRDISRDDERYVAFAKEISKSGVRTFIRFACEMNDENSNWYVDSETYKTKYRYVADIFRRYAPSAALVWSPNFYPEDNFEEYYPGDEYVDYVGISSYLVCHPETDPLGKNIDRSRWSSQLDTIYSLYGYKKPIIISEGGASYESYATGNDATDFAAKQLYDFYTYLPLRYPNIKAVYHFDNDNGSLKFKLSANQTYLSAYKAAINNNLYLEDPDDDEGLYQYYELGTNVNVYPENTEICSYFTLPFKNISYVAYQINSNDVAAAYAIPYKANIDFSPYSGESVEISALAFDASGTKIAQKTYMVKVWDFSENKPQNIYTQEAADISVSVNGDYINCNLNPVYFGNSVMIPFKEVAEELGYSVKYDEDSHSMTAVKKDRKVRVTQGTNTITVNNTGFQMEAAPIETAQNFLISADALDKGFRCEWKWKSNEQKITIDERKTYWSDWDDELPRNINEDLYYVEEMEEYRYRSREKEYFSMDYKFGASNYVKTITHKGEWSDWQRDYISSSDKLEVRTRTSSEPKAYYYGHYCTGDVGDKNKNYRTASHRWCDEAVFHELGWFDYKLPTSESGSDDTILYNENGKEKRCPSSCYRWYVIKTEGGEYTEYSCRTISEEHIYCKWSDWSDWSSWSEDEFEYDYDDETDYDIDERTLYRYKEK